MCDDAGHQHHHGHGHLQLGSVRKVQLMEHLLENNEQVAARLRQQWSGQGIYAINLISSPGAGKTTLLRETLPRLAREHRLLVFEGDIETDRDARILQQAGIEAHQITTGGACHLDARMVETSWQQVPEPGGYDFLFIENVGNLVCPAGFSLGEHLRVVLLSVPEGSDKVLKYPKAFRTAQLLLISKLDLLPHFEFSVEQVKEEALALQPEIEIIELSARTGEGVEAWLEFLERARAVTSA